MPGAVVIIMATSESVKLPWRCGCPALLPCLSGGVSSTYIVWDGVRVAASGVQIKDLYIYWCALYLTSNRVLVDNYPCATY
jgi:hypothetical protein